MGDSNLIGDWRSRIILISTLHVILHVTSLVWVATSTSRLRVQTQHHTLSTTMAILTEEERDIDPYEVLGLTFEASEKEVRKAYRKKSLKCHPDKVRSLSRLHIVADIRTPDQRPRRCSTSSRWLRRCSSTPISASLWIQSSLSPERRRLGALRWIRSGKPRST